MGVVADTFWRIPGVLRSDSPHSFAVAGPQATRITAPHPVEILTASTARWGASMSWTGRCAARHRSFIRHHHPPGRTAGRRVLPPPQIRPRSTGRADRARVDYGENDHCCQNFALADGWLDAKGLQRRGVVGHAGRAWSARVTSSKPWWKDSRGRNDLPPSLWRGRRMRRSAGQYSVLIAKSGYNSTKPSNT